MTVTTSGIIYAVRPHTFAGLPLDTPVTPIGNQQAPIPEGDQRPGPDAREAGRREATTDLVWYRHLGIQDGTHRWEGPSVVGEGWESFAQVFPAGDGVIYAVDEAGQMFWYRHIGCEDGSRRWEGPAPLGKGWNQFSRVFSGGDGIIYAVRPHTFAGLPLDTPVTPIGNQQAPIPEGDQRPGPDAREAGRREATTDLVWYRHLGIQDGTHRWEGPSVVGEGWESFAQVFPAGDGVIYAVDEAGQMFWYRHIGCEDGSRRWEGPAPLGKGWNQFSRVFSGGDGIIYAVRPHTFAGLPLDTPVTPIGNQQAPIPEGDQRPGPDAREAGRREATTDLVWYRHLGIQDGTHRWEGPSVVGEGWESFAQVFATGKTSSRDVEEGTSWCDFMDPPNAPKIGIRSYLLKEGRRQRSLTWSLDVKRRVDVVDSPINGVTTPELSAMIEEAFATWSAVAPLSVAVDPHGGDIQFIVEDLGSPGPLARTASDGSTIAFNSNPNVLFKPHVDHRVGASLRGVATHEIGHALGLLHTTTPGTMLYPKQSPSDVLAKEDIAAIRALYGWAAPTVIDDKFRTATSPVLCLCDSRLVLAWRGADSDSKIYRAHTDDGVNWSERTEIPGVRSADGPSLAWDPGSRRLFLAIRGEPGNNAVYWASSSDLVNFDGLDQIPGAGSAAAPSLAVSNGIVTSAWRGIERDDRLWWSRFRSQMWDEPQLLMGGTAGSEDRPSISDGLNSLPRLVWRGVPGDDSLYTSGMADIFWQPQASVAWVIGGNGDQGTVGIGIPGSAVGPSVTRDGDILYMAWRGVKRDSRIFFTQASAGSVGEGSIDWSSQTDIEGCATSARPAIAVWRNSVILGWKGAGSDTRIWTTRQVL